MDGLAVALLVGHEEGDGGGHGRGGLDLDADGVEGFLEPRENGSVGPGGGDGVEADGEACGEEDGVETAGEAEDGVFCRCCCCGGGFC